ncbi:MAG TPA: hypothetical protein VJV77_00195, partial [Casimicrobiaceae bacterium]|nr:hypothetical protein [Casimicrobiaceae bacterium]
MATPAAVLPAPGARAGHRDRPTPLIAAIALVALAVVPWAADGGAPALGLIVSRAKWPHYAAAIALGPLIVASIVAIAGGWLQAHRVTAIAAGFGLAYGFVQGFVAGGNGPPFGIGAALTLFAFTLCFARAIARLGLFAGNVTIASIVVTIALLLLVFIFYPVGRALVAAVLDAQGKFAPHLVGERLLTADIWGLGCFGGGTR